MSAHTPGPWSIDWNVGRIDIFRSCVGTLIASIRRSGSAELDETAKANARLIAAAPDMLEALKRIKATGVFVGAIAQEMMDEAIAKAEGRS
jgi:hypothetical protein